MMRPARLFGVLCVIALGAWAFGLALGSVALAPAAIVQALTGADAGIAHDIVVRLRLPRVAAAFATGGLLALAGALMQVLLRNPLADPYILGIAGGASTFALLAVITGAAVAWLHPAAFLGAMLSMVLVFGLARSGGAWNPMRLLLTGVVVAAGWGAVISFLLSVAPERQWYGMLFWLLGDLSYATNPVPALVVLGVGLLIALGIARALNVLAHGEQQALALGVSVGRLHAVIYFLASLLTATAVTIGGSIGFIGLITPHWLRLLGARDHRWLLPSCVLLGGSLLVVADTLARTVMAPRQLPVGVLTALIGVPVFLYLLRRQARSE